MANNRMWLVNDRTGDRVLLAKYYPNTGWYVFSDGGDGRPILGKELDAAFDRDLSRSMWGPTDWRVQYEQEES